MRNTPRLHTWAFGGLLNFRSVLLVIAVILVSVGCGRPSPARDADLDTLRDAYLQANGNIETLQLRWTESIGLESFDDDTESMPPRYENELKLKEPQSYYRRKTLSGKALLDEIEVYDGETSKSHFPLSNEGRVNAKVDRTYVDRLVPIPFLQLIGSETLLSLLEKNRLQVDTKKGSINGSSCYVLTYEFNQTKFRMYMDPGIGYMPRCIERYDALPPVPGRHYLRARRTFKAYRNLEPTLWIPMRLEVESFRPGSDVPTLNVVIVTEIVLNQEIPDDTFTLIFPPNTDVHVESEPTVWKRIKSSLGFLLP